MEMKSIFDNFVEEAETFIENQKEKKIRDVVTEILEQDEEARGNDNYLIYKVFKQMGWSTDLREIAKGTKNKFESISRARRKAQELNPMLLPAEKVVARRRELEEETRIEMRGLESGN